MKLGEAIKKGSKLLKPLRGVQDNGQGEGCAWGMALHRSISSREEGYRFLEMASGKQVRLPCGCEGKVIGSCGWTVDFPGGVTSLASAIVHVSNQHVIDGDWSIDELADWVTAVENCAEQGKEAVPVATEAAAATAA